MAGVDVPHASVGIVTTEDKRAAGDSFNAEIQMAPTREMYRWMSDVTDCVKQLSEENQELRDRLTAGGL